MNEQIIEKIIETSKNVSELIIFMLIDKFVVYFPKIISFHNKATFCNLILRKLIAFL